MSLTFNYSSIIHVNDTNVQFDLNGTNTLPLNTVDLAVVGVGNLVSGNFVQKSSDVEDISSNFTFAAADILNAGFYLSKPDHISLSAFGNTVQNTGDNLKITGKDTYGGLNTNASQKWFVNLEDWAGDDANVLDGNTVVKGKSGPGAVLVQAAAAALFKALGKNAAINNDKTICDKEQGLASSLCNAWTESSATYANSHIFKRYLGSGRYAEHGTSSEDVNTVVSYNLVDTKYDFIVQLKGNVSDSSNSNINYTNVLGTQDSDTKVDANGSYTFNIYMSLEHHADA